MWIDIFMLHTTEKELAYCNSNRRSRAQGIIEDSIQLPRNDRESFAFHGNHCPISHYIWLEAGWLHACSYTMHLY